ncbi:DUF2330 domain-containing protein [Nocardioides speluncae]|uniref:DUF2330 domain-containing protein n=1 Tax=Nocardioides speluncae TaxID=2670337 RepID=UPI00137B6DAA|nr:DUF2330 domain-containing protein [Nocardioides speluncae]
MSDQFTRRAVRAIVLALMTLTAFAAVSVGTPARACACGAFISDSRLEATHETALVTLDEGRDSKLIDETVTVNIATETDADAAAFVMPVPERAKFELADPKLFVDLNELSKPEIKVKRVEIEGDGAGAPGDVSGNDQVIVTDQIKVGPYDVAQLSGTSSQAVATWLKANGFKLSAGLGKALTPYLQEGWKIVAVKLTPTGAKKTFADGLPPMQMAFQTAEPVYPMRLSKLGNPSQPFRLYVLADHRMDITNPTPELSEPEVTFAGWVAPEGLADYPALAERVTKKRFLTRYDKELEASKITDDIRFTQAEADEAHRAVVIRTEYVTKGGISGAIEDSGTNVVAWVGFGVLALFGVAAVAFTLGRRRRGGTS